jgi:hypothetical protein
MRAPAQAVAPISGLAWHDCRVWGGVCASVASGPQKDRRARARRRWRRRWDSNPRCSSHTRFPVAPTRPLWDSSSGRVQMQNGEGACRPIAARTRPGGEGGIRTHGALFKPTAFRERHHQPLGHLSVAQYSTATPAFQATDAACSPGSERWSSPVLYWRHRLCVSPRWRTTTRRPTRTEGYDATSASRRRGPRRGRTPGW